MSGDLQSILARAKRHFADVEQGAKEGALGPRCILLENEDLRTLIDALSHTPSPPEGWKLVPIMPTDDMLVSGQEAISCCPRTPVEDCDQATVAYRAMLTVAPLYGNKVSVTVTRVPLPAAPVAHCKGCNATPCHCDPRDPLAAARRGGYEEA